MKEVFDSDSGEEPLVVCTCTAGFQQVPSTQPQPRAAAGGVVAPCHHGVHLKNGRRPDIPVHFFQILQEEVQGPLVAYVALIHGLESHALPIRPPAAEVS